MFNYITQRVLKSEKMTGNRSVIRSYSKCRNNPNLELVQDAKYLDHVTDRHWEFFLIGKNFTKFYFFNTWKVSGLANLHNPRIWPEYP